MSDSSIGFAQSGGGTLSVQTPANFAGILSAFGSGDVIQLAGVYANSLAFAQGELAPLGSNNDTLSTLTFAGSETAANFHLEPISGGTQIDFLPSA